MITTTPQRHKLIETLNKFGMTPTYHKVRRFKVFAAAAADNNGLSLNMNASYGLIKVITGNFDATINSQNNMTRLCISFNFSTSKLF